MTQATPTIDMHCPRRRATAMLGLVALALLQVSIAAHQFEHSVDHGFNVCHACTAFSESDDAPHSTTAAIDLGTAQPAVLATRFGPATPASIDSAYRPRAPPRS